MTRRTRPPSMALWSLWLAACSNGAVPRADGGKGDVGRTAEARPDDGWETIDVARLHDRKLSGLAAPSARAVCEAVAARTDTCTLAAQEHDTRADCQESLRICRALSAPPRIDCSGERLEGDESCTARTGDYLRCLADWSDLASCDYSGRLPPQPASCVAVTEACPSLYVGNPNEVAFEPCDADSAEERVDNDDDIHGLDACRPVPVRMVVLGDSIAACVGLPDSAACAPALLADHLREPIAPDLRYDTLAHPGLTIASAIARGDQIEPGPGHVLVWLFAGGNDLYDCAATGPAEAPACIEALAATGPDLLAPMFDYFADRQRFPDGATFLVNTQYSLFDACDHPLGPERVEVAESLIQLFNEKVLIAAGLQRDDTVTVDHFPDWLGHGPHANQARCPHCYRDDNRPWLIDGTHPNEIGQQHIADKWKRVLEKSLSPCDDPR